jgi:hypothetical protein
MSLEMNVNASANASVSISVKLFDDYNGRILFTVPFALADETFETYCLRVLVEHPNIYVGAIVSPHTESNRSEYNDDLYIWNGTTLIKPMYTLDDDYYITNSQCTLDMFSEPLNKYSYFNCDKVFWPSPENRQLIDNEIYNISYMYMPKYLEIGNLHLILSQDSDIERGFFEVIKQPDCDDELVYVYVHSYVDTHSMDNIWEQSRDEHFHINVNN